MPGSSGHGNHPRPLPDPPPVQSARLSRPSSPRVHRLGTWLAWAAAVAVALLTLLPQAAPTAVPSGWRWCLACGRYGGADLLQNVLLFLPLGVGLGLAGRRPLAAAALALALSGVVEALQLVGIAGRFASAGDLVANAAGGWLGALAVRTAPAWRRPRPAAARRLAAGALALWVATLAGSGWALRRDPAPGPPRPTSSGSPAAAPEMGWFAGTVHAGWVDGRPLAGRPAGPLLVGAAVGRDAEAAVVVSGSDPRPAIVPLLYVHGWAAAPPELVLGQQGADAVLAVRLRAARLRLRQPRLRVPHVFAPGRQAAARGDARVLLRGGIDAGTLRLTARTAGGVQARTVRLAPTLGWALLLPFARVDGIEAPFVTVAWLGALVLPVAYWSAAARLDLAAAAATLLALALVPPALGAPGAGPLGWGATLAWLLLGTLLGRRVAAR